MHERRPVPTLPEGSTAIVTAIEELDVSPADSLHQRRKGGFGQRCRKEMQVIPHQRVGVNTHTCPLALQAHDRQEYAIVCGSLERGRTIHATLRDVPACTSNVGSKRTGHAAYV